MNDDFTAYCYNCKAPYPYDKCGRKDECTQCGRDLHICLNCQFYDPNAYNQCREPQAERILDKERSNFCDLFRPIIDRDKNISQTKNNRSIYNALDDLFK